MNCFIILFLLAQAEEKGPRPELESEPLSREEDDYDVSVVLGDIISRLTNSSRVERKIMLFPTMVNKIDITLADNESISLSQNTNETIIGLSGNVLQTEFKNGTKHLSYIGNGNLRQIDIVLTVLSIISIMIALFNAITSIFILLNRQRSNPTCTQYKRSYHPNDYEPSLIVSNHEENITQNSFL